MQWRKYFSCELLVYVLIFLGRFFVLYESIFLSFAEQRN